MALHDSGVQAIGYYGKMKEREKIDAYQRWKYGEYAVIVATRAFVLGINKPDVRYVIRNGSPPSISAWDRGCRNLDELAEMGSCLKLTYFTQMMKSIM